MAEEQGGTGGKSKDYYVQQLKDAVLNNNQKIIGSIFMSAVSSAKKKAEDEIKTYMIDLNDFYKKEDNFFDLGRWKDAEEKAINIYLKKGAMNMPGGTPESNLKLLKKSGSIMDPRQCEYRPIGYSVKNDLGIFDLSKEDFPGLKLPEMPKSAAIPTGKTTVTMVYQVWVKFSIDCEEYFEIKGTRDKNPDIKKYVEKCMDRALMEAFGWNQDGLIEFLQGKGPEPGDQSDSIANKVFSELVGDYVEIKEAVDADFLNNPASYNVDGNGLGNSNDIAKLYYGSTKARKFTPPSFDASILGARPQEFDHLRIGDYITSIPPEAISVTRVNSNESMTGIRQSTSVPQNNGYEQKVIRIPIFVTGMQAINGKAVTAPTGGFYYIDGVRSLLAQFKKTPFLPVENEHLNDLFGIYAVALSSINVQTVQGFPDSLVVELTMLEFDPQVYSNVPSEVFDSMFDWDLFRWYYQDILGDDFGKLRKIDSKHLTEEFKLGLIREDSIQGINSSVKGQTFDIYDLGNYVEYDLSSYPMSIVSVTGGYQNLLPKIQLSGTSSPSYQYLGCTDGKLSITLETKSRELCSLLNMINDYINKLARDYHYMHGIGFCFIKNDIANLMGMSHCVIDTIDVATVTDFPGLFRISIELTSYDSSDKLRDGITGFNPFVVPGMPANLDVNSLSKEDAKNVFEFLISQTLTMNAAGLETKIRQDDYVEKVMSTVNLYPDLKLPTYEQADAAISSINSWRSKIGAPSLPYTKYPREEEDALYGNSNAYVDPDFYMMYPVSWAEIPDELYDLNKVAKEVFDVNIGLKDDFNGAMVGVVEKFTGAQIEMGSSKAIKRRDYTRSFMRTDKIGEPAIDYPPVDKNIPNAHIDQIYNIERSYVDMIKYNKRGRLLRAFPTYLFSVVDDSGAVLDGRRLWSNYYIIQTLMELNTHATRETGVVTLRAQIKNTFGTLSKSEYQIDWMERSTNWFTRTFGMWFGTPKVTTEALINKVQIFKSIDLKEGARIHVRMGYGNSIKSMPIVFNGRVTEVTNGKVLSIMAQSDGIELHDALLETQDKNDKNGLTKLGEEPSDIIKNILQNRQSWMAHLGDHSWFEGNKYGIEHFGMYMFGKDGSAVADRVDSITSTFDDKLVDRRNNQDTAFDISFKNQQYWQKEEDPDFPHNFNDYDLVKNLYTSDPEMRSRLSSLWSKGGADADGQSNTNFVLYGKSAWDVMQICVAGCPEYVCQPVFHQFESRVFFGHPSFMYKDRWLISGQNETRSIKESGKTFSQVHCVTSVNDIIMNEITSTSYGVATNVNATYNGKKGKVTSTLYADKTINNDLQKNVIASTEIHQGTLGEVWDFITFSEDTARKQANKAGVSILIDQNKKRYSGSLLLIGDPSIKPCDRISIFDDQSKMTGMVEVREVSMSFAADIGFVTDVVPDMVTFNNVNGISAWREVVLRTMLSLTSIGVVAGLQAVGASIKMKKFLQVTTKVKDVAKGLDIFSDAVKSGKIIKRIQSGVLSVKVGIIGATGGLTGIVLCVAGEIVLETLLVSVIEFFKFQNCIKVLPLSLNGKPYISGVKGQTRLIIGGNETPQESSSSLDERIKWLSDGLDALNDGSKTYQETVEDAVDYFDIEKTKERLYGPLDS